MALPVTRPMQHYSTVQVMTPLYRPHSPGLALPPSNGTTLPYGGGVMHGVQNPAKVVVAPTQRVVGGGTLYRGR